MFHGIQRLIAVFIALLMLLVGLSGCQTVPESEREQLLFFSPAFEIAMGRRAFEKAMLGKTEITEGEDIERMQAVGERLLREAQPLLEARGFGDLDWSFHLVDSDKINAFVVPSGQVVFYAGILPILQDEDGMATVMGHEIAHVVARHGGERVSQQMLLTGATWGLTAGMADNRREADRLLKTLGLASLFFVELPYSRAHESEADRLGLRLMARAGYDPTAAPTLWKRMEEATLELPALLSTHPPSAERREALAAQVRAMNADHPGE